MYDAIKAYPGKVNILISGTAASAATVVAMAADHLSMTPGSIFMIHDPSTACWGNIADFEETLNSLRATKESILNLYGQRSSKERAELAQMMTDTCWMDANEALTNGFVDEIAEKPPTGIENAVFERRVSLEDAKAKYDAWRSRTRFPKRKDAAKAPEKPPEEPKNQPETPKNPDNRVKVSDRMKRLALLK
nr:MAG TPA: Putative ATP dependent Clp protease [Caudoviricetes sp.]